MKPDVPGFVDLHIHSSFSGDGEYTPEEIFAFAARAGMRAFAIGDHDTVAGIPASLELAHKTGAGFIPSIELTTQHCGRELHILGPCIEWNHSALAAALENVCRQGEEQARERVALLRKLGFEISWEELSRHLVGAPSSGYIIGSLLLRRNNGKQRDSRLEPYISGPLSDRPESNFYRDYFAGGTPAYVPRWWMDTLQAIDLIRRCGGVPVLAHPGAAHYGAGEELISELVEAGLKGLEVYSSYHRDRAIRHFLGLARRFDLIATAGSDFHGRSKPHVGFGSVRAVGEEVINALRDCRQAPESAERMD